MKKLNLLFLCNKPAKRENASTIIDHIEAFEQYSGHYIWSLSMLGGFNKKLDLSRFDGIIIHYSLALFGNNYLSPATKQLLHDYQGLKILFIQDEYRKINEVIAQMRYLGITLLFTCFPEEEIHRIYTPEVLPNTVKYNNLTGYVPEWMLKLTDIPAIVDRPLHLGYRSRKLPFWYGELGYEKWSIVDQWKQQVDPKRYRYDLSYHESERLYGQKWIKFLTQCKAVLGVESGASVMDFTGKLEHEVEQYQIAHPQATFQEVQRLYLVPYENQYKLNQISPRCFEAIALKAALVLYEGEYSGILIPDRHYISLKKDFSNISDVLAKLDDDDYLQTLVDRAYQEIALNPAYSYQGFIAKVDQAITEQFQAQQRNPVSYPYTTQSFCEDSRVVFKVKLYNVGFAVYKRLPYRMRLIVKNLIKPYRQQVK